MEELAGIVSEVFNDWAADCIAPIFEVGTSAEANCESFRHKSILNDIDLGITYITILTLFYFQDSIFETYPEAAIDEQPKAVLDSTEVKLFPILWISE